jgi:CRISPR-associated protein Cmr5
MNTIAQKRSLFALTELNKVPSESREKFKKLSAGLPAMILQNGLGQTLAFLLAKGKGEAGEHTSAFNIIAGWLKDQNIIGDARSSAVVKELSSITQGKYLKGQEEALSVLEWVKRYANAGIFE